MQFIKSEFEFDVYTSNTIWQASFGYFKFNVKSSKIGK